jgi:hypothetical protein
MLKNYINADILVDVLSGNFDLGYTDVFVTEILNDPRDIIFELKELNANTIAMVPITGENSMIWNGRTGFVSSLDLHYTFSPPEYVRNINGIILQMVLDEEVYLDVDSFSVDFSSGAICFSGDLIDDVLV